VDDHLDRAQLAPDALGIALRDQVLALVLDAAVAAAEVRILLVQPLGGGLHAALAVLGRLLRGGHGLDLQMGLGPGGKDRELALASLQ
jgi:hypothetical protein